MTTKQQYAEIVVSHTRKILPRDVPVCVNAIDECWDHNVSLDDAAMRLYDDSIYFANRF